MKKQIYRNYVLALGLIGVMLISMLAGIPHVTMIANAEETKYGLSNPRIDGGNHAVIYDCVYFGNYWQEDTNNDGKADQNDDKMPIKWRVLSVDGDEAFLIADNNLEARSINDTYDETVTWETCTMRSWLNGYGKDANACGKDYTETEASFIGTAFDAKEQAAIKEVLILNKNNPNRGTEGGNDTRDKIFLLSLEDIENESYGFTNYRNRINEDDQDWGNGDYIEKKPCSYYNTGSCIYGEWYIYDYAKLISNTAYIAEGVAHNDYFWGTETRTANWWLRSPGEKAGKTAYVGGGGNVFESGDYVSFSRYAVCPALYLKLSSTTVWKKAGKVTYALDNIGGVASDAGIADVDYGLSNPRVDKDKHEVVYDCVYFGNYWQEDTNNDGKADENDEKMPIKWRILSVEGNDVFLIADKNLDRKGFNELDTSVTWETCTMRSWLNGYGVDSNKYNKNYMEYGTNFISNAFNIEQQSAIIDTLVKNKHNRNYDVSCGNDTIDKIFLLSYEDIACELYGFTNYKNKLRISDDMWDWGNGESIGEETQICYDKEQEKYVESPCQIYDYAKLRVDTDYSKHGLNSQNQFAWSYGLGTGSWFLRSMGDYFMHSMCVGECGDVFSVSVGYNYYAVCPALHLDLSKTSVWKPAGTVTCKPGNIGGIASEESEPAVCSHIWDGGVITVNPTEVEEGVKLYTCTLCGTTKEESVPKKEPQTTETPTTPSTTEKPTTPSTTEKPTTPNTTEEPTTPSTTEEPTTPSTTEEQSTPNTTEKPTTPSTTEKPTTPSTTEKPTVPNNSNTLIGDDKKTGQYKISVSNPKEVIYCVPANKNAATVTVPSQTVIGGTSYRVTKIDDKAFYKNKKITKVIIGKNIRIIGKDAFNGASKLKSVKMGENVEEIGKNAFRGCGKLKQITFFKGLKKIGDNAFLNCKSLKRITFKGKNLTTIGKHAFKGIAKHTELNKKVIPQATYNKYKKMVLKSKK